MGDYVRVPAQRQFVMSRALFICISFCLFLTWTNLSTVAEEEEVAETEYRYEIATSPDAFLVYEDSDYFEIVSPESLSYTFKLRRAKDFGGDFDRVYNKVRMVVGEPVEGCRPISNSVAGTVTLLLRGGCSFLTKSKNAEHAGAIAVIIADNDEENDDHMVDMVDDSTDRSVEIPSLFLMGKDGVMIRRHLMMSGLDEAIINIPVNLTGVRIGQRKQPPWTLW